MFQNQSSEMNITIDRMNVYKDRMNLTKVRMNFFKEMRRLIQIPKLDKILL